jgi:C-terminal processing protease CtpA/Prc
MNFSETKNPLNMNTKRRTTIALLIAISALSTSLSAAEEKGWFGLAFNVETEGFSFNPTIQSVKIEKVVTASPAAQAGLAAGDVVVSLQGVAIAGAKADDLKAAMKKSVGETLRMKVKHGAAEPTEIQMVAIAKPAGR